MHTYVRKYVHVQAYVHTCIGPAVYNRRLLYNPREFCDAYLNLLRWCALHCQHEPFCVLYRRWVFPDDIPEVQSSSLLEHGTDTGTQNSTKCPPIGNPQGAALAPDCRIQSTTMMGKMSVGSPTAGEGLWGQGPQKRATRPTYSFDSFFRNEQAFFWEAHALISPTNKLYTNRCNLEYRTAICCTILHTVNYNSLHYNAIDTPLHGYK